MSEKYIVIKGARENNLKNINLKLPKDKLIVMTGLSGSGKSSLAFDTIYAEGQRRYQCGTAEWHIPPQRPGSPDSACSGFR